MAAAVTRNADPIAILTYHQIDQPPPAGAPFRGLVVSPASFARHMRLLKLLGYRGLSLSDLMPYLRGEQSGKVVGITFDDGYRNNLTHAAPVLQRLGFTSTCYVVSQRLGQTNRWDRDQGVAQTPLMAPADLLKWRAMGQEVGAHTRHHVRLVDLPDSVSRQEITACRSELEDTLGAAVRQFCYPYGAYRAQHVQMVREAGFVAATTTHRGRCLAGGDLFTLTRVPVLRSTSLPVLWLKLATAYEERRQA